MAIKYAHPRHCCALNVMRSKKDLAGNCGEVDDTPVNLASEAERLTYHRNTLGPSTAPIAAHSNMPPPYQTKMNGAAISPQ